MSQPASFDMPKPDETAYPFLRIGECRQSITSIGVVWPVELVTGRCGCGQVEMFSPVAFFVNRDDAEKFIGHPQAQESPLCVVNGCQSPAAFRICGICICREHEKNIKIYERQPK